MSVSVWCQVVLAAGFLGSGETPADPFREQKQVAEAMLDAVSKGDYDAASKAFDETMRKALPPEKLQTTWKSVIGKLGAFQRQTADRAEKGAKFDFVYLTCQFEKETLDIRVVLDKEKRIAGFSLVPTPPKEFPVPPYAKRDDFREEEVVVGKDGDWPLPGTLTMPKGAGPFPAVILVHGSGPNDRDETIFANKPFRDLAWGLASQGVAVLRYQKRTKEHGLKFSGLKTFTIQDESVDDTLEAAHLLRKRVDIDPKRVFVVGHSLGAVAAPLAGEQDPRLAGLILMAGNARPLEDLIVEQYEYGYSLKGDLTDDDRKELDKIKQQVARVKDPKLAADTPKAELPLGIPGFYWLHLRTYDDVATTAKLKMPVLVLQGERDYQVTMADFALWKKGLADHKNVTLKSYPALNHLFMEGKGKSRPDEYMSPGHVSKEVVDDIAAWVKGH
jgi:dienelactone hydrolase